MGMIGNFVEVVYKVTWDKCVNETILMLSADL